MLEPEAVHTGMAAVPEGWTYQVLYVDPAVLCDWTERDGTPPRATRWVVFRDPSLRRALLRAHAALAGGVGGLGTEEAVAAAISGLAPHLRSPAAGRPRDQGEHAAVRRVRLHLQDRWDQRVSLAELAAVAGLSRFELIRRFHRQNGLTPSAYQRQLRVGEARRLLADGVPAAAVAAACGFADQSHLSRVFKRLVGVSPGGYAAAGARGPHKTQQRSRRPVAARSACRG